VELFRMFASLTVNQNLLKRQIYSELSGVKSNHLESAQKQQRF
jgi:hypothetical protein